MEDFEFVLKMLFWLLLLSMRTWQRKGKIKLFHFTGPLKIPEKSKTTGWL